MPKKPAKSLIDLDLLKPQSEPQKLLVKALRWILSSGRFMIIFVEILVLGAFVFRFKLDADIAQTKEAIDEQIPFIESLKSDEDSIRDTQLQIATIQSIREGQPQYSLILQKIATQTPTGVTMSSLILQKTVGRVDIKISGTAQTNGDLSSLITGLKNEGTFQDINLVSANLEQGLINFSVSGTASQPSKNL